MALGPKNRRAMDLPFLSHFTLHVIEFNAKKNKIFCIR